MYEWLQQSAAAWVAAQAVVLHINVGETAHAAARVRACTGDRAVGLATWPRPVLGELQAPGALLELAQLFLGRPVGEAPVPLLSLLPGFARPAHLVLHEVAGEVAAPGVLPL